MTDGSKPDPKPAAPANRLGRVLLAAAVGCAILALFWPRGRAENRSGGFLLDSRGQPTPLAGKLAPVTLLHFWASWCPPCLTEIPELARLVEDFHAEPKFRVLLVAVEEDAAKAATFLGPELAGGALFDPRWEVAHRYGTYQLPETYLLVDGAVVERFVGATAWSDPGIRARIKAALAGRTPAASAIPPT